ncbi:MAG: ParA family protein [Gemmataceae bacterium]
MRRIAIINQKGGSGKTTTTVSLGACLAEQNKRVLIIDLDGQHSTTLWFAAQAVGRGVFELFVEPTVVLKNLIRPTATPRLSLVASSAWLVGAEKALSKEPKAETILREKMSAVEDDFDYVLIDCPPTLGVLAINALTAADEVLAPVEAHFMGCQGLAQLIQSVQLVGQRLNPGLTFAGIFACRVDHRTKHSPEIVEMLRKRFPETLRTTIRENIRLAECPSTGVPITTYAPTSTGAEDYRALATEIIEQEGGLRHAKVANQ